MTVSNTNIYKNYHHSTHTHSQARIQPSPEALSASLAVIITWSWDPPPLPHPKLSLPFCFQNVCALTGFLPPPFLAPLSFCTSSSQCFTFRYYWCPFNISITGALRCVPWQSPISHSLFCVFSPFSPALIYSLLPSPFFFPCPFFYPLLPSPFHFACPFLFIASFSFLSAPPTL